MHPPVIERSTSLTRREEPGQRTADYHYDLPPERIAQTPAPQRDRSRLMVVDRAAGSIRHAIFADLAELVPPGDLLVFNETRVFPARLLGRKTTGAAAEVLLLHPVPDEPRTWTALVRPGGKLRAGHRVEIGAELSVEIVSALATGERIVRLHTPLEPHEAIQQYGRIPLPPYVEREPGEQDRERYQTVYARDSGSVAAPTAGLHFTPELLDRLNARGARRAEVVLHVGVGTFRPVEVADPSLHPMHSEWYRVPPATAAAVARIREQGAAVWAVGTTTVRTLESVADATGVLHADEGWTDIFIRPPYRFRAVDRLITNFHLPQSTLLMLVAAFAGYDLTMTAYREAVACGYRFYSYGDAMVVL